MERRVKIGPDVEDIESAAAIVPQVVYANSGRDLTIKFSILSTAIPSPDPPNPNHPQKDTHLDIFERAGGSIYGTNLKVALSKSGSTNTLTISMDINAKIPGTGAAGEDFLDEAKTEETPQDVSPEKKNGTKAYVQGK